MCGLNVGEIIAAKLGTTMAEVGYYRIRPPIKPITLNELATMESVQARNFGQNPPTRCRNP
jgi:hypothetical protein